MSKNRKIQLVISAKDKASRVLNRVKAKLKSFGAGALKMAGVVTGAFAALTGAVGVLLNKFSEQIDEQAKVASSLGLTNQALGVFRDAAGYAGISAGALTTALRKMSQGIADAANGTGEAKDALEKLGLDAEQLQQQGPEQAFKAIVEQLGQMKNGIEKTSIAMDIFGRSGAAMANLTSEGLRQAQRDADQLGLKLTSAQAANVEAANDAWSRVKMVFSDFGKYVTASFAPQITSAATSLFNAIKGANLKQWASETAYGMAVAFQGLLVVLGAVGESIIGIGRVMNTIVSGWANLAGWAGMFKTKEISSSLKRVRQEIADLTAKGFGDTSEGYKRQHDVDRLREIEAALVSQLDKWNGLTDSAADFQQSLDRAGEAMAKAQGFSQSPVLLKAMGELKKAAEGIEEPVKRLDEETKKTESTMRIAFSGTAEAAEIAGNKMARINSILEEMRAKAQGAAIAIADIPEWPKGGGSTIERLEQDIKTAAEQ